MGQILHELFNHDLATLESVRNLSDMVKIGTNDMRKEMRKAYPSDVNRGKFENIRPILENVRKKQSQGSWIYTNYFAVYCTF